MVGRQPILDQYGVTYGYELLYRSDPEESFGEISGDQLTSSVINNSFYDTEMGPISSGKKSFINFTSKLILDEIWRIVPRHQVVIELLESIQPTAEIIKAVEKIKHAGYRIALDDFVYSKEMLPLVDLADIIKVDVQETDQKTLEVLAKVLLPKQKRLLAEKVEALDEFKRCRDLGYTLFQGYYFARPQVINSETIPESKTSKLRLMQKLHLPDIDYGELVEILKTDPNLSLKLLKYINSVSMGVRHEITSLRQALALIGLNNFKKWASVLIMASFASGKPKELLRLSLFRGRFCELISADLGRGSHSPEYFLVGIFSLLDATLDKPMASLVQDLPLADDIIETLLGHETVYQQAIRVSMILETGDDIESRLKELGISIPNERVAAINQEAILWSDQILTLLVQCPQEGSSRPVKFCLGANAL